MPLGNSRILYIEFINNVLPILLITRNMIKIAIVSITVGLPTIDQPKDENLCDASFRQAKPNPINFMNIDAVTDLFNEYRITA